MKSTVTARTGATGVLPMPDMCTMNECIKDEASVLCGKAARVCYCDNDYSEIDKRPDKGVSRFEGCLKSGHHSVLEHYNVSIVFEGVSKMQTLLLNSSQIYSTSERSGRYTVMTGNTDEEVKLYTKWLALFSKVIKDKNPDIAEKTLITKAQENARYLLSVFTHSSTIYYTTNLRQWNVMLASFREMRDYIDTAKPKTFFWENMRSDLEDLIYEIERNVEIKGANFGSGTYQCMFTAFKEDHPMKGYHPANAYFRDTYIDVYNVTPVALAQLQRHRAIKYYVDTEFEVKEFYIPPVIRGTAYEKEWLGDLAKLSKYVPQATIFKVIETGFADDFIKKCYHRLCRRVQLETMEQTKATLERFITNEKFKGAYYSQLKDIYNNGDIKTKCKRGIPCTEPCEALGMVGKPLNRDI